jgi:hypothetical protein
MPLRKRTHPQTQKRQPPVRICIRQKPNASPTFCISKTHQSRLHVLGAHFLCEFFAVALERDVNEADSRDKT